MDYKKKLLFFPQNETHLQNMLLVKYKLSTSDYECCFLNLSAVYKQTLVFPDNIHVITLPGLKDQDKPFYLNTTFQQLKIIIGIRKHLLKITRDFDALVVGNDGAIQRLLIHAFNKKRLPTILILDGIITDVGFSLRDLIKKSKAPWSDLKEYLFRNMRLLMVRTKISNLHYILPSMNGASPLTAIYVIGQHSKNVVAEYNKSSEIHAFGLPRMKYLFQPRTHSGQITAKKRSIWFLTSAFLWHNFHKEDMQQHADIKNLCAAIKAIGNNNDITLYIKLHPREEVNKYNQYLTQPFVKLVKNVDLIDLYDSNALIFSNLSTCILEGAARGKIIHSLMINFEWWKFQRSFLKETFINKIYNIIELEEIVRKYLLDVAQNGKVTAIMEGDNVISFQTVQSDTLIARHMGQIIKQISLPV